MWIWTQEEPEEKSSTALCGMVRGAQHIVSSKDSVKTRDGFAEAEAWVQKTMQTSALSPLNDLGTDAPSPRGSWSWNQSVSAVGVPRGSLSRIPMTWQRGYDGFALYIFLPLPPRPRRCGGGCYLLRLRSLKWRVHTEKIFHFHLYLQNKILPRTNIGSMCPPLGGCPVKWDWGLRFLVQVHPPPLRDRWRQTAKWRLYSGFFREREDIWQCENILSLSDLTGGLFQDHRSKNYMKEELTPTVILQTLTYCLVANSYLTILRLPVYCSPPGSSVHGISQARILEWVAISSSRGSFGPRDRTHISCVAVVVQLLSHVRLL